MRKIICDRCGKEIKDPIGLRMAYVDVETGEWLNPVITENQNNRDYCGKCAKAILQFAEKAERLSIEYKAAEKNEALEKEEPDNQGKRIKIDIGKVMALKNAGWSAAKIADEMNISTTSVYNAVHYHKKRMQDIEARR